MGIALALKIPIIIVITKIDICPENILKENTDKLKIILKNKSVDKIYC